MRGAPFLMQRSTARGALRKKRRGANEVKGEGGEGRTAPLSAVTVFEVLSQGTVRKRRKGGRME